jgi:uncharacterized membrane protein YuzA (DUF378 family)
MVLTLGLVIIAINGAHGQDLNGAASNISTQLSGVKTTIKTICLVLAGATGAWGLVQVMGRATQENRESHSHFIRWFIASGSFALAWTLMTYLFNF